MAGIHQSESVETASWVFLALNSVVLLITIVAAVRLVIKIWQSMRANIPRPDGGVVSLFIHLFLPWGPLLSVIAIAGSTRESFYRPLVNPFINPQQSALPFTWESFAEELLITVSLLLYLAIYPLLFIFWSYLSRRQLHRSSQSRYSSGSVMVAPARNLRFGQDVLAIWGAMSGILFLIWVLLMMLYTALSKSRDLIEYIIAIFIFCTYFFEGLVFLLSLRSSNISGRPVLKWFTIASSTLFLLLAFFQTLVYFADLSDSTAHFVFVTISCTLRLFLPLLPLLVLHWRKSVPSRKIPKPSSSDRSLSIEVMRASQRVSEYPPLLTDENDDDDELLNESFTDFLHNLEENDEN